MCARASTVGRGNSIFLSSLPDLRRAGSRVSTLLVAAITCEVGERGGGGEGEGFVDREDVESRERERKGEGRKGEKRIKNRVEERERETLISL